MSDWGRALRDPDLSPSGYLDLKSATRRLTEQLADGAYLLVVDDVWSSEHVRPFLAAGPHCLLLVTSRKAEIATDLGMETVRLDEMAPDEALQLMELWAGPISPADRAIAEWLASEVGFLPLALELIGARVRQLGSWPLYRARWEDHRLGALTRRRGAKGPLDSLQDSIALSVNDLKDEDRDAYITMGVFPEDTDFTAGAVATLLGSQPDEATDLLLDLSGQGLLGLRVAGEDVRCRFHDMLHEYVVEKLGEDGLHEAHKKLIAGYRRACKGIWHAGISDGYYFEHLAYHLRRADARAELYQLVSPGWMEARYRQAGFDYRGFLYDLALALDTAALADANGPIVAARVQAARQVVHAEASLGRPADLAALVYLGRGPEALANARLEPWGLERFRGLAAVTDAIRSRGEPIDALLRELERLRAGMTDESGTR